jgi:hypothetical protein
MKVIYAPEVDVLSVLLSDAPVAESDRDKPGVVLDYDGGRQHGEFRDSRRFEAYGWRLGSSHIP